MRNKVPKHLQQKRIQQMAEWVEAQESKIQKMWDSLSPYVRVKIRERYLPPGGHAPADIPLPILNSVLESLKMSAVDDSAPEADSEFLAMVDVIDKDSASLRLGSDTYIPQPKKVQNGRRRQTSG